MSETAPSREQRMVHVLRPRFELNSFLSQELLDFVEPVNGQSPTILGAYATREVVLDAEAFHSGKYGRELVSSYQEFEQDRQHILIGEARTTTSGLRTLPRALRIHQLSPGTVQAALRPRDQESFDEKIAGIFDFQKITKSLLSDRKMMSYIERIKPYMDKQPQNHRNYLVIDIGSAALKPQFKGSLEGQINLGRAIDRFSELVGGREGTRYYAQPLEIKGRDEPQQVEVRAGYNQFSQIEVVTDPDEHFDVA